MFVVNNFSVFEKTAIKISIVLVGTIPRRRVSNSVGLIIQSSVSKRDQTRKKKPSEKAWN